MRESWAVTGDSRWRKPRCAVKLRRCAFVLRARSERGDSDGRPWTSAASPKPTSTASSRSSTTGGAGRSARSRTRSSSTSSAMPALVVEEGSEMIGFLLGFVVAGTGAVPAVKSNAGGRRGYVHLVGIHPDYRRRGVGRLLYDRFTAGLPRRRCVAHEGHHDPRATRARSAFTSRSAGTCRRWTTTPARDGGGSCSRSASFDSLRRPGCRVYSPTSMGSNAPKSRGREGATTRRSPSRPCARSASSARSATRCSSASRALLEDDARDARRHRLPRGRRRRRARCTSCSTARWRSPSAAAAGATCASPSSARTTASARCR